MHYVEWGPRKAKRVALCAHGYSGNARDFDYLAREMAADGTRVVCIDFPGRGDSQWLTSSIEYNLAQFAADARTLIAQLEVDSVDWIGTSMGGLVGMLVAARAASPVRRLVMNDVGAYLPMDALAHIARGLDAPSTFASLEEVEAHLRRTRAEWGDIDAQQWRAMARHHSRPAHGSARPGAWRLHFDPRIATVVRPPPFAPGLSFWNAWYRVHCPVLLLRGATSEVFPLHVARTMLDIRPEATLVEIEGCGHAPALMSAAQSALVRGYLDQAAMSEASTVKPWFLGMFSALSASSTR